MGDQSVASELRQIRRSFETVAIKFGETMAAVAVIQQRTADELKRIADAIEEEVGDAPDGDHEVMWRCTICDFTHEGKPDHLNDLGNDCDPAPDQWVQVR